MRKVILYIAMSLDGFIAGKNDSLEFLEAFNGVKSIQESFEKLESETDVMMMGRKTYDVIRSFSETWPHPNHQAYVITSKDIHDKQVNFYHGDLEKLILDLKARDGKDIWLVGGGQLVLSMIKLNLIDLYQIAIAPILLGQGTRLFLDHDQETKLKHIKTEQLETLTMLTYAKI